MIHALLIFKITHMQLQWSFKFWNLNKLFYFNDMCRTPLVVLSVLIWASFMSMFLVLNAPCVYHFGVFTLQMILWCKKRKIYILSKLFSRNRKSCSSIVVIHHILKCILRNIYTSNFNLISGMLWSIELNISKILYDHFTRIINLIWHDHAFIDNCYIYILLWNNN